MCPLKQTLPDGDHSRSDAVFYTYRGKGGKNGLRFSVKYALVVGVGFTDVLNRGALDLVVIDLRGGGLFALPEVLQGPQKPQ